MVNVTSSHGVIRCSFCNKMTIKAFHKPSHLEPKTTHISAGSKTTYHRVLESYDVLSGCSACGKSRKEVQKAFDTGVIRELSHEERLKMLRKAGLPTRIVSKRGSNNCINVINPRLNY